MSVIVAIVLLIHSLWGGEPVKTTEPIKVNNTDNFPTDYKYAGWRGGIGIASFEPATVIPDVTELGLDIIWGGENPLRASILDIAVFHYWNSIVEISLKDPGDEYDFSKMNNKDQAAKLAFDKYAELRYGVPGLSEYAEVKYSPGSSYGDVVGKMDLSSNNPLVKAVVSYYLALLTGSGIKYGGVALDNADKVPESFLDYFFNTFHPKGYGIATNTAGTPEQLYRYIDFMGREGFRFSQPTANDIREKGFKGILAEFATRQMSSGELERYLKAKQFNGIVYFGYTDGLSKAAGTYYSFYTSRPDIYNHQRWILRQVIPLCRAMFRAESQKKTYAYIPFKNKIGNPIHLDIPQKCIDEIGGVIESEITELAKGDVFEDSLESTLFLDGSIHRYGNDISKGIYLYINTNEPEIVQCNTESLRLKDNTIIFDEFSETPLEINTEGSTVQFQTLSGPSLIQLGSKETVAGNILLRVIGMFDSQLLQREMDEKFGLGYIQKSLSMPTKDNSSKSDSDNLLQPWEPFCQGYVIDHKTRKSGRRSLRTDGNTYSLYNGRWSYYNRQGAAQFVTLNQSEPASLILTAYSKSENVQKSELTAITEINRRDHFGERLGYYYAMHLYLDYQDGNWPEVYTFAFTPGTHDWEEGKITVVPKKAVKTAMVLVELHQPEGTAWFDDFSLVEKSNPGRNLLACADFENSDAIRAKAKAQEYNRKVSHLMTNVKEVQKQVSMDKLEKLEENIRLLRDWLILQDIAKMYGREMRDLIDAQHKLNICKQLLTN